MNGCGAIMKYERYADIERDFSEGQLHPLDLKKGFTRRKTIKPRELKANSDKLKFELFASRMIGAVKPRNIAAITAHLSLAPKTLKSE